MREGDHIRTDSHVGQQRDTDERGDYPGFSQQGLKFRAKKE